MRVGGQHYGLGPVRINLVTEGRDADCAGNRGPNRLGEYLFVFDLFPPLLAPGDPKQ